MNDLPKNQQTTTAQKTKSATSKPVREQPSPVPSLLSQRRPRSPFAPSAFSESLMPALRLVRSSRKARLLGKMLLVLLVLTIFLMAFAPWQQSVRGEGDVMAYSPQSRPQVIEALSKGRIVRWGEGVYENAIVEKGQFIAEIQDLDPNFMTRLEEQLAAAEQSVASLRQVESFARDNLLASQNARQSYERQARAYEQVKIETVASADAYVEMAKEKLSAEKKKLEALEAARDQELADYNRQKQLFEEKIVSELKFQMAERKYKEAVAKVETAQFDIEAARDELEAKQKDRNAKEQKAQAEIEYAETMLRNATGYVAKAESDISKATSELNKAIKDKSEMQTKLSQQKSQIITAPLGGSILNLISNQGGAYVKVGDPICTIVPETTDRAVEMTISGNDVPLIEPGRHVRLQFEGWPAVQFSGWPSVAVGTFGGTVVSVNQTDDGKGKFRCLVLPDETEQEWPDVRYLRQGVRANGWILVNQVPLWYEVWRKLNGFPIMAEQKGTVGKSPKPPKLAKP